MLGTGLGSSPSSPPEVSVSMVEVSSWEHGGLCQEGSETCMIALVIISFFSLRGSDQVRLSECFPFRHLV